VIVYPFNAPPPVHPLGAIQARDFSLTSFYGSMKNEQAIWSGEL